LPLWSKWMHRKRPKHGCSTGRNMNPGLAKCRALGPDVRWHALKSHFTAQTSQNWGLRKPQLTHNNNTNADLLVRGRGWGWQSTNTRLHISQPTYLLGIKQSYWTQRVDTGTLKILRRTAHLSIHFHQTLHKNESKLYQTDINGKCSRVVSIWNETYHIKIRGRVWQGGEERRR
jgi:hypothetical protein